MDLQVPLPSTPDTPGTPAIAALDDNGKANHITASLSKIKQQPKRETRSLSARAIREQKNKGTSTQTTASLRNPENQLYIATPMPVGQPSPLKKTANGIVDRSPPENEISRAEKIKMTFYKQSPQYEKDKEQYMQWVAHQERQQSKNGFILLGVGALFFGGLAFYFFKDRLFPAKLPISELVVDLTNSLN